MAAQLTLSLLVGLTMLWAGLGKRRLEWRPRHKGRR